MGNSTCLPFIDDRRLRQNRTGVHDVFGFTRNHFTDSLVQEFSGLHSLCPLYAEVCTPTAWLRRNDRRRLTVRISCVSDVDNDREALHVLHHRPWSTFCTRRYVEWAADSDEGGPIISSIFRSGDLGQVDPEDENVVVWWNHGNHQGGRSRNCFIPPHQAFNCPFFPEPELDDEDIDESMDLESQVIEAAATAAAARAASDDESGVSPMSASGEEDDDADDESDRAAGPTSSELDGATAGEGSTSPSAPPESLPHSGRRDASTATWLNAATPAAKKTHARSVIKGDGCHCDLPGCPGGCVSPSVMDSKFFLDNFECPVCFVPMAQNMIYQCSRGHIFCEMCFDKIDICGMCREKLPRTSQPRCRTLEFIRDIYLMPYIRKKCEFEGCDVMGPWLEMLEHEAFCGKRVFPCPSAFVGGGRRCRQQVTAETVHFHCRESVHGIVCSVRSTNKVYLKYSIAIQSGEAMFDDLDRNTYFCPAMPRSPDLEKLKPSVHVVRNGTGLWTAYCRAYCDVEEMDKWFVTFMWFGGNDRSVHCNTVSLLPADKEAELCVPSGYVSLVADSQLKTQHLSKRCEKEKLHATVMVSFDKNADDGRKADRPRLKDMAWEKCDTEKCQCCHTVDDGNERETA